MLKIEKDKLIWGFWQKSYTYIFKGINKALLVSGNVTNDLKYCVVTIRGFNIVDQGKGSYRFSKSPVVPDDVHKSYIYELSKNIGKTKTDFILDAIAIYGQEVYNLNVSYENKCIVFVEKY